MNKLNRLFLSLILAIVVAVGSVTASSHREAPLIANDPLADNVDVYAFRSPDNPDMVTLIATYIPFQLPQGGPNYYTFGENIRYEIHVDNDAAVAGDEVTYRFTFNIENEDPTTFFNMRLGKQNQKATYTLERSMDGGVTFETIIENGIVPPNNIGDRSITGAAGLNSDYNTLWANGISTASTGETVFAGPSDDPFFVDLGGIFDLGDAPRQNGTPVDGAACYNVSTIAIQVPISTLLKEGAPAQPENILDPNYVIGVWASASRPSITTLSATGAPEVSGDWVQVSRLGMPLTNEAVIPIGYKDFWNAITPYDELAETEMDEFFYNPELALYMDDDQFGGAVPAFGPLRIQTASLGAFDFTNGADGVSALAGGDLTGTAFEQFGDLLLIPGKPRSVDLWPIFHTGVPNAIPYQLATGKEGNPLAAGKPFINNFLPNGGDMLRLNMAVPPTPRDDPNFSSLGLVQAAAIGLTVAPFNTTADLEFIPNMDGFPNGRRLEDDVTRIELQAVGGVVLAAVGLWYNDYDPESSPSPVTDDLLNVLTYTTGVEANDVPFGSTFPYVAQPFSGTGGCSGEIYNGTPDAPENEGIVFASSNNSGNIGVFGIDATNDIQLTTFSSGGMDADGIYYDAGDDVLFQLNRSENRIDAFKGANNALTSGVFPSVAYSSSSEFSNGRELAVRGDRLVVAQDANDGNGNVNKFAVYVAGDDEITFEKELISPINLWGIQFVGSALYAIEDNSANVAIFTNFLGNDAGAVEVDQSIVVENMIRTHGLTIQGSTMVLTDVGSGADPADGALVIIENYAEAVQDGMISADEQIRIEGDATFLGNPVDVALDTENDIIYVAERANEGGRILGWPLSTDAGNTAPRYNRLFAGASAVFYTNFEDEVIDLANIGRFYSSSNTEAVISVYDVKEDLSVEAGNALASEGMDGDGIHYEWTTDLLYEADRSNNVVNVYSNVAAAANGTGDLVYEGSSSSDFSNARELVVIDDRLVVAQDANDANGQTNKLVVYRIDGTSLALEKEFTTTFNLWGMHVEEDALYAIIDNSNRVAILNDFFAKPSGNLSADSEIVVEGLVRTHGISYDIQNDVMVLTDVAEASSDADGAIFIINDFTSAAADGTISAGESNVIAGASTLLGNPVDVAIDEARGTIYVAERANSGGQILGFQLGDTGDIQPTFVAAQAGASAIFFDNQKTGTVSIAEAPFSDVSFKIFPNPTNNLLTVDYDGVFASDESVSYTITTMSGIILRSGIIQGTSTVNVAELSTGMYMLTLNSSKTQSAVKFTKVN